MGRRHAQNKAVVSLATVLLCLTVLSTILLASLSGANTINTLVTGGLLAVVCVGIVAFKHKIWLSPELSLFLIWITFSLISTLNAYHVEAALWKTFTLVQIALMVFAVQQTVLWGKHFKIFAQCFALAIAVSYFLSYSSFTAYELAQMEITGEHGSDEARIASTLADANMFGVTSCLALTMILMSSKAITSKLEQILSGLLITVLIIGIVHSGSRTAFIGLFVILLGAVYTFRLYNPARLLSLGAVGAAVAGLGLTAVVFLSQLDSFQDKFDSLFIENDNVISRLEEFAVVLSGGSALESEDGSISGRTQMMVAGLDIVKDNPITGVGLDNFRYVSGADTYAHSTPIELLVSTGVIGACIYYMIYAVLFYRLFKLSRRNSLRTPMLCGLFGLMAYVLMDITHVSFSEKTSWIFLAMLSATVEVQRRSLVQQRNKIKVKRRKRKNHKPSATDETNLSLAPAN